jgi:uncharacterized protein YdeI (YjbR/CyaY-like superfamily)
MPPELVEKLLRNRAASEFFDSLAPSYRDQFVAWIKVAKRDETRQRRIEETLVLLSKRQKLGMR